MICVRTHYEIGFHPLFEQELREAEVLVGNGDQR